MDPVSELSKSRLFAVVDGTVVMPEQSDPGVDRSERLPGSIIDKKYQILNLLGKGGMGAVYRAHHLMLNKDVALKTFASANLTEATRLRFQREAQSIAKLTHQNVIQIFDFGLSEDDVPYYTMEYLLGESLADRISRTGPLPIAQALEFFMQICQGLSVAHNKGIIHRDLKPGNVYIESILSSRGKTDRVKIVDFGIASLTDQDNGDQKLTTQGLIFGSPLYMSPEQSTGQTISYGADIYSLGCTFFEALVGKPPFRGANALDTIMLHHSVKPPTLKDASGGMAFPSALERAVAKMLAKDPGNRQANVAEVAADISSILSSPLTGSEDQGQRPAHRQADLEDTLQSETEEINTRPSRTWALVLAAGVTLSAMIGIFYFSKTSHSDQHATGDHATAKPVALSQQRSVLESAKSDDSVEGKVTAENVKQGIAGSRSTFRQGKDEYVTIKFPPGFDIGYQVDLRFPNQKTPIIGTLTFCTSEKVVFQPSAKFLQNPNNLSLFAPNLIASLDFKEARFDREGAKYLSQIGKLTSLVNLDLEGCAVNNEGLKELYKLSNLYGLSLNNTNADGSAVALLPYLKKLNTISFSYCVGAHQLLMALKGSSEIKDLYLDGDLMTADDFKIIGSLQNLNTIQINNTGMTNSELASLASLKKLKNLDARGFELTTDGLESLKIMHRNGLHYVKVSAMTLSKQEQLRLKGLIPGLEFADDASTKIGNSPQAILQNMAEDK